MFIIRYQRQSGRGYNIMNISNTTARQFNVKFILDKSRLTVRLVPGVNSVEDKIGEALKKDEYFQSLIELKQILIGGKPEGDTKAVESKVSAKPKVSKKSDKKD